MQDYDNATANRLTEITKEFQTGFELLKNYPKSVTFFGASHTKTGDPIYDNARLLAGRIVQDLGYSIVTGGSSGIMEAANRGAKEAGGHSLGLQINLPHEQMINGYLTESANFHHFFVRKVCLSFYAEAFVFYPGGYGTLDEFFEILTLIQTGKIDRSPVICVGSEYWNKMKDVLKTEVLGRKNIAPEDLDIFTITDNHDEILEIVKNAPIRDKIPFELTKAIQ